MHTDLFQHREQYVALFYDSIGQVKFKVFVFILHGLTLVS